MLNSIFANFNPLYLIFIISTLWVVNYSIGHFIYTLFFTKLNIKPLSILFVKIFFGITTSITLFALYHTDFNTVFLFAFILINMVFTDRQKNTYNKILQIEYRELTIVIIINLLLLFGAYYFYYIYSNGAIFGDNQFYATIATVIANTGVEGTNLDWTSTTLQTTPYHYAEIWQTALLIKLFKVNSIVAYCLLTTPFWGSVIALGGASLYEVIYNKRFKTKPNLILPFLFGFLLLFIQSVDLPFVKNGFLSNYYTTGSWFRNIKFSSVYIILLMGILGGLIKEYKLTFYVMLLLVPFYTPTAVAVIGGLSMVLLYLIIFKKIEWKQFLFYMGQIVLIVVLFFVFYFLQQNKTTPTSFYNELSLTAVTIRTIEVYISFVLFSVIPISIILYVIYRITKQKKATIFNEETKQKCFVFLSFVLGSLSISFMVVIIYFYVNHDAFQLFYNFHNALLVISFYVVLLYLINIKKWWIFLIAFGYFSLLLWQNPSISFNMKKVSYMEYNVDTVYFNRIKKIVEQDSQPRFAYIRDYSVWSYPMELKPFLIVPDNRIAHFLPRYTPIVLSVNLLPEKLDQRYAKKTDFAVYNFIKRENKTTDFQKSLIDFVNKYKIKYIIVENPAVLPAIFKNRISIKLKNKINKNQFIVLDKK